MTAVGRDRLVLAAILALAAGLRLIALPRRGEWDDDQGIEMLAMLGWVRDGRIPLLGPVSSAPTVHHGAWFYWILAPGAFATDAHPMAAVATLAVLPFKPLTADGRDDYLGLGMADALITRLETQGEKTLEGMEHAQQGGQ